MSSRVLVTGATGLLGSVLVRQLVQQGVSVRAMKRKHSSLHRIPPEIRKEIEWVEGDVRDLMSVEKAVQGVHTVFHCAAHVAIFTTDLDRLLETNVQGTRNVLEAIRKSRSVEFLVHVSSVASLGRAHSGIPIDESVEWKPGMPTYPYALSKWQSEREVFRAFAEGIQGVIVNPSIILGPGNWKTDSSQIIGRVARARVLLVPPGGSGFVDVEDVAQVMIQLWKQGITGERFIVSAENWLFEDVFRYVARCLGIPYRGKVVPCWMIRLSSLLDAVAGGVLPGYRRKLPYGLAVQACKRIYYDNARIRLRLSYQFRPLRETLARLAKMYLEEHNQHIRS